MTSHHQPNSFSANGPSEQLRQGFIDFFVKHGHQHLPSSSVSPQGDPSLLFTNAGMNQFKPFFLGSAKPSSTKAVTCQKCVRVGGKHNDLENVGHTPRHLTFFEMLGNFSFGDYFKEQAIALAWECTQSVFQFDPSRIYVSVFRTDNEAYEMWQKHVPSERIVRMDEADNYWSMGAVGPCGPCSELYYDVTQDKSGPKTPKDDPEGIRFLEFWNLVFMQEQRDHNNTLLPLPSKNIDTGAGLERLVALKLGVKNIFEIDILGHIVDGVLRGSGMTSASSEALVASRVIADHLRMLCFSISDGVLPSNTDQGYILRKVIRRAARYGKQLGHQKPFLSSHVQSIIDVMGPSYSIKKDQSRIEEIIELEEESFLRTLSRGGRLLFDTCQSAKNDKRPISGLEAFKLKDTYGMPFEEIVLLAKDNGLTINTEAFLQLEEEAKEISRSGKDAGNTLKPYQKTLLDQDLKSTFCGYEKTKSHSKVLALFQSDQSIPDISAENTEIEVEILFDQCALYVEQGGQISDTGTLVSQENGQVIGYIFASKKIEQDDRSALLYRAKIKNGSIYVNQGLEVTVDLQRRQAITQHHSATHLLNFALKKHLGEHIAQKGSLVTDKGLRFDFNHHKALSPEDILQIERTLLDLITSNAPVLTEEQSYAQVRLDESITQAFGDRYGASVRVVTMGPSKELCGGTHVQALGEVGPIFILKESSISAGVRRIEAVAGMEALNLYHKFQAERSTLAKNLKTSEEKISSRVNDLLTELSQIKKEQEKSALERLEAISDQAIDSLETVGTTDIIALNTNLDPKLLPKLINKIKAKKEICNRPVLIALFNESSESARIVLQNCGTELDAGMLIQTLAPTIGGKGGGRKDQAQAGGSEPSALPRARKQLLSYLAGTPQPT